MEGPRWRTVGFFFFFLSFGPAAENKLGKMGERGPALAAAELRRDALIAPSGCGRCPGEEQQQQRRRRRGAGLTLPDVITGPGVVI